MQTLRDMFSNQSVFIQTILVWVGLGLILGVAAKLLMPGSENMGWLRTIILGIAGSFIGIMGANYFFNFPKYSAFSWQGLLLGVAGALLLVIFNRVVTKS